MASRFLPFSKKRTTTAFSGKTAAPATRPVPFQCSTYPFWSWMVKDKEMWEECARDCPGMNNKNGKLWTYEEIEANKNAYDANKPLYRREVEKMMAEEAGA